VASSGPTAKVRALRRCAALVTLLTLPAVAAAAPAPEIVKTPGELERWVELKADEFVIVSNAGKGKTEEIAEHLLRFRAVLAKASKLPIHSPLPISVYAFKSTSAFAPYRDIILARRAKKVAGFFIHAWDGPLIVFDASGRWNAEHVIYHELTHAFMGNQGRPLPLWLREGAADFYAAFAIQDGAARIGLPTGQITLLRKREWVPLAEVLAADNTSPLYTDATRAPLFYAESWAMVHYLYADCPKRRGQLGSYLEQLAAGRTVEQAFASAFGTGFSEFEKELKAYVNGPAMQYLVLSSDHLEPISVGTPTAIPHDEVLARLGYLLLAGSQASFPSAEAFLTQAFKFNPHNVTALTGLGIVREREGRPKEGWTLYQRALEFAPDDLRTDLHAAEALLERLEKGNPPSHADGELARDLLRRALRHCPNLALGWAELGRTYVLAGDNNDAGAGVDALERCLALDAQDYPAARDLIVLCVRQDRLEYAAEVNARFLSTCGDAALVSSAHEALVRGELERAERLLAEGRLDDALKTAEQADRGARAWQAGGGFVAKAAALRGRILAARQQVAAGRKPDKTNWR
jgi:tetratricopeptide (TPR) repeat protein